MAAKPDGKGVSAAEANRILRAKFLTLLAFPSGVCSPVKRERWQTKSDEKGASAAEAKWILRAERVKDERGLTFSSIQINFCL